ncbi:MAG TPA: ribosomal protein S18-alanine N-acetyltransferase [Aeromicrobium sp.]|nr:ribosomal protein S18-alanine N-acetyltransferase [Aeromicrobium sp.]
MIRPARAEDADALATLECDAFAADAWSLGQVEDELASATRHVIVAESGGHIVGYGAISIAGDVADLTRIVIADSQRRAGVASALLVSLHNAAGQAGVARILLEVAESNVDARAFYAAHGYAELSRRRDYYASGDDALVLGRAL